MRTSSILKKITTKYWFPTKLHQRIVNRSWSIGNEISWHKYNLFIAETNRLIVKAMHCFWLFSNSHAMKFRKKSQFLVTDLTVGIRADSILSMQKCPFPASTRGQNSRCKHHTVCLLKRLHIKTGVMEVHEAKEIFDNLLK